LENSSRRETAVAVFDFDDTLIKGDSLWAFFAFAAGWPRVIMAMLQAGLQYASRYMQDKSDPVIADERTFLKSFLLEKLLAGKSAADLQPAIKKLSGWVKWNEPILAVLREKQAAGSLILIATGSLDLYLPELLKSLPPHDVVCTRLEIKDSVITGVMSSGNCVRDRKAELVAAYLAKKGPFIESWGYGNYPHDVPMLNLVKHRIIV
jgi:phosphatidylglycerophosphatase C